MRSMLTACTLLLASYGVASPLAANNNVPQTSEQAVIEQAQQWINYLASDQLRGRKTGTAEMQQVQNWLEQRFSAIGLQPLPGADGYRQEFTITRGERAIEAVNLLGYLPCQCDSDKYIMIGAHYDHVGVNPNLEGDQIFNGADDDASGVVASLVIAQQLAKLEQLPFNIIFVAWDAEEMGLLGSKHFVENPLVELNKIETGIMFELVGTPVDEYPNNAWMTGDHYSNLLPLLQQSFERQGWTLSEDPFAEMGLFMRSDNAPFALMDLTREKAVKAFKEGQRVEITGIPMHAVSIWRGQDHYHQVHDEAELIDVPNLVAFAKVMAKAIAELDADTEVTWQDNPQFNFSRP